MRQRQQGFTLLELLVIIAVTGGLIHVPRLNGQSVHNPTANAQQGKSDIGRALCDPPFCDTLLQGSSLRFPATGHLEGFAGDLFARGVSVSYDAATLAGGNALMVLPLGKPTPQALVNIPALPSFVNAGNYASLDGSSARSRTVSPLAKNSGERLPATISGGNNVAVDEDTDPESNFTAPLFVVLVGFAAMRRAV